jgi:hypothetical protein
LVSLKAESLCVGPEIRATTQVSRTDFARIRGKPDALAVFDVFPSAVSVSLEP